MAYYDLNENLNFVNHTLKIKLFYKKTKFISFIPLLEIHCNDPPMRESEIKLDLLILV